MQVNAIGFIEAPSNIVAAIWAGGGANRGVALSDTSLADAALMHADKSGALPKLAGAVGLALLAVEADKASALPGARVIARPYDALLVIEREGKARGMDMTALCEAADVSEHELAQLRLSLSAADGVVRCAARAGVVFIALDRDAAAGVRTAHDLKTYPRRLG